METGMALIAHEAQKKVEGKSVFDLTGAAVELIIEADKLHCGFETLKREGFSRCPIQNLARAGAMIAHAINQLQKK